MKIEKSFECSITRMSEPDDDRVFRRACLPGASIVEDLGDHRYKGRMSVESRADGCAFDGEIAM